MIPLSPKTQFAIDLIRHLRSLPELAPYVMDRVYNQQDQISIIDTVTGQYGGCIAVTPQSLTNPSPDATVRDARLVCDYGVMAFAHASLSSYADVAGAHCAADLIDALLGVAISMISSWTPEMAPYDYPVVIDDADVALDEQLYPDTLCHGLRVRTILYYPTII